MKKIYLAFIFNLLLSPIFAQSINSTMLETNFGGDSEPDHLTRVGNKIFFSANVYNDRELYVKDNLNTKPRLVKDINSNNSSIDSGCFFKELNGVLLFTADSNLIGSGNYYQQLWRSDGTESGTYLLKIINPNYDTSISNSIILGSKMFFTSYVNNSNDLWVTDGTEVGTKIVKKINPNGNSNVLHPFIFNNEIYFLASDGITGTELWKTDGTEIGTTQVLDFYVGSNSGLNLKPIVYNNKIYFIGKQNNILQGLWSFDGTQTQLIKNFSNIYHFDAVNVQNKIMFCINTSSGLQLWTSDGTPANTITLFTNPPYSSVAGYNPLRVFNNKLYFEASDSSFNQSYWTSEGTAATTVNLSSYIPLLSNTTIVAESSENSYLFFRKNNNYNEHYISDGTTAGTKLVSDINLTSNYTGYSLNAVEYNNTLVLNGENIKNGIELFNYNFSTNTSTLLDDLNHRGSSDIDASISLNNNLIYFGNGFKEGMEVFKSDGTLSNTKIIKDMNVGNYSTVYGGDDNYFFKNGNKAFFRCSVGSGFEPCVTDGTEAGTYLIKDLSPYNQGSLNVNPFYMALNNNITLFGADDGSTGTTGASRLWRTDGTVVGTYKIHDVQVVNVGTNGDFDYANFNGKVYFTGYDSNNIYSIWETDGTNVGTQIFKTYYNSVGQNEIPRIINVVNNKLIIVVNDKTANGQYFQDYWSTDGSASSSVKFARYRKNAEYGSGINTSNTIVFNNKLYFYTWIFDGTYPTDAYKLYMTDGTVTGTNLFSNLVSNCCGMDIKFTLCGNNIYILRGKLYVTDGINQPVALDNATHNFKDFNCVNNNLFFLNSQYQDYKIWTSNGTVLGTYPFTLYANGHLIGNEESIYKLVSTEDKLFYLANFYNTDVLKESGAEIFIVDINNLGLANEEVIQSHDTGSSFVVFPNPVNEEFNVQSKKGEKIKELNVYDTSGKLVLRRFFDDYQVKLNLNNMLQGVYFVTIKSESQIFTKKIIKK